MSERMTAAYSTRRAGVVRQPSIGVSSDCFFSTRGVRLHYIEWGERTNPPLVLLHGGSAHAHWWDHIASALAPDYRVLALDLRGHGDSSWVSPPAYEVEDYVADLEAFVSILRLTSFVLLGHSLGGFVALSYATTHAKRLKALIVVDIGFRLGGSRFMRLLRHLPMPVYRDETELLARFRLLPAETSASPELLHHIARYSVRPLQSGGLTLKFDRATLTRELRDLRLLLPSITCPTLFFRGSDSQNLSVAALAEMVQSCLYARGVEIPSAGHHVFLDNPAAFLEAVRGFLDEETEACK